MSYANGRVLVLGANGETGRRVIQVLQEKSIPARAMVRSAEKAKNLQSPTTEIFIGEVLKVNDIQEALNGITAVISTIGTRTFTDLNAIEEAEYITVANLIDAAKMAGVERIVLCSSMGSSTPESIPPLSNILRAKHRGEEALIQSGLTYTIVHPGGLRNDPTDQGVLVQPHPANSHGLISRDDVAEVLVQALLQPEARNKSVDIVNQAGQGPATRSDLFS